MRYTEGRVGRVFVVRLEHGDEIPSCIENFAAGKNVLHAQAIIVGGIGGGQIVVGPRRSDVLPPDPMLIPVDGAHEVVGVGVIAPDATGRPVLHMHAALGRSGGTATGCVRPGVTTWMVGEVVLIELEGVQATRIMDAATGFALLEPGRQVTRSRKTS
ncbi:MAG TPA: DUF296 domain-containing protein [Planctomycetes bacterium]|nr:DUF296 domain-containing protein [Planctomycetota bacterium]